MTDSQINAIILIRRNGKGLRLPVNDDDVLTLIEMGDKIRPAMNPNIEVTYNETQELAIFCSSQNEIANETELEGFDFESFDKEFEKEFLAD